MGDVVEPERPDIGLAEDRTLPAELEEHVYGRQHALNLRQSGLRFLFAANSQMRGLGLVILRRLDLLLAEWPLPAARSIAEPPAVRRGFALKSVLSQS